MDKTIVGLIAAIGSIATMAAAQAAVTPDAVDRAVNAPAILKAANDQRAATTKDGQPYRNTYTWYFQMTEGKALNVTAFFDTRE